MIRKIFALTLLLSMTTVPLLGMDGLLGCLKKIDNCIDETWKEMQQAKTLIHLFPEFKEFCEGCRDVVHRVENFKRASESNPREEIRIPISSDQVTLFCSLGKLFATIVYDIHYSRGGGRDDKSTPSFIFQNDEGTDEDTIDQDQRG